jgi:hypothetical protein
MMRVLLSASFGLQLRLSSLVTRRPEIWDRAPAPEGEIAVQIRLRKGHAGHRLLRDPASGRARALP